MTTTEPTTTLQLPRSLVPWAEHLDLLPRELALALGPLVARLDALIGTLHRAPKAGTSEPDGFDGLERRGSYERLLLSEWLLADEAPDEFLRRAAVGEHAFHRLAHRDPAASRVCVALFDAGPNQAGSPRLVHLAALIVLARRAQSAGARFAWGVWQQPKTLHETVSAATIRQWLHTRGLPEANPGHEAEWRAYFDAQGANANHEAEVWSIGGRRLNPLELIPASRLVVRDVLEPGARSVGIEVRHLGRAGREVVLELPEEMLCARLLRDPFASATSEVRRTLGGSAAASVPLWVSGGSKLLVRSQGGDLVMWSVPNGPAAGVGKPKVYRTREGRIVAAGRIRKTIVAVVRRDAHTLNIECFGKHSAALSPGDYHLETPLFSESEALLPCLLPPESKWMRVGLPDQRMVKIAVNQTPGAAQSLLEVARGAVAAAEIRERLIHLPADGSENVLVANADGQHERVTYPLPVTPIAAFHGFSSGGGHPIFGLWAVGLMNGRWQIIANCDVDLTPPSGARVIGVLSLTSRFRTPALVVLEADGRAIWLIGPDWKHHVVSAPAPILHASVSPFAPSVAFVTQEGELAVYSLQHDAYVLRSQPGRPIQR